MGRKVIFLHLLLTIGAIRVSVAQQPVRPTIDLPLHTRGSLIVDSRNYPVRLVVAPESQAKRKQSHLGLNRSCATAELNGSP
jgi:hypothetical protein